MRLASRTHVRQPMSKLLIRTFTSSATRSINPIFNLAQFAGSKEAQWLSKQRRIPRIEYHPHLELIRSSEVDPFAPTAGASPTVISALNKAKNGETDMKTAYTLAVTNLVQQLQASRREAKAAANAFDALYFKYKKQETVAFLAMISIVAISAFLVSDPDFVRHSTQRIKDFSSPRETSDWQWLGNPPPHVANKSKGQRMLESSVQIQPLVVSTPVQTEPMSMMESVSGSSQPQSWLSRFFWKATT